MLLCCINYLKKQGIKDVEEVTKEVEEKKDYEEKGAVRFYLEKYAPYIIGAIFFVLVKDSKK